VSLLAKRLESLQRFGWKFGLDTIRILLAELGDPQRDLRFVHVAGTNGKGATCAYLESILRVAGYRTGLYTSPHLISPRERFRIAGACVSRRDYERLGGQVLRACAKFPPRRQPTYFEAQTAMAFLWFREQDVDVAIMETGLGGRLDATNVIGSPLVSLITPVGLEHQDILGATIEHIAREKAGILKRGCFAATIQEDLRALGVLRERARKVGAFLAMPGEDFPVSVPVPKGRPSYDAVNAALAVAGIRLLRHHGFRVGHDQVSCGLDSMRWPGRFEIISRRPLTILDGAHNPHASRALSCSLHERFPKTRWIVINGYLGDKDHAACVKELEEHAFLSIVTDPPSERAGAGIRVFEAWECAGVPVLYVKDWRQALRVARIKSGGRHPILVTGSLYLVGACREALIGTRGLERL